MKTITTLLSIAALLIPTKSFTPISRSTRHNPYSAPTRHLSSSSNDEDIAFELRQKAALLRQQAADLESTIDRSNKYSRKDDDTDNDDTIDTSKTLKNKRIFIAGANGRLGSMITRHLLRTHPEIKEVLAGVHYVGQATTRGYGRLSYEVGAEDGAGSIGPIWSEAKEASFTYDAKTMDGYNLNKLRIVEVELLDPMQVKTVLEDVDAVIYCATDFEGNRPRAVASLNAAFLFRAVADPFKGRVEIEGVRNCLEGLLSGLNERRYRENLAGGGAVASAVGGPTQFILVSSTPDAFSDFETPFGEFNGLKRQSESIVKEFPSISHCVLQMGRYDERVEEGSEIFHEEALDDTEVVDGVIGVKKSEKPRSIWDDEVKRRINRRDAARAAVEALLDDDLEDKKVQCYTYRR